MHGHVPHAVGAGQRAVHPVEARRLGRADVGADVLERVVAQREQLAVGGERRLEVGDPRGRRRAPGQVLEPVLRPAHGHAELARGEADQHDVDVDRRLDPEAAARVRRRDQPQLRALQAERRGGDRVQRERALEVRPRGQDAAGLVPVRDDAVALDRAGGPAREREALGDDEVGGREGRVRVAVREGAVGDDLAALGVEHGLERLVLDLDQLERVLGGVAVARDDDRERLARVARDLVGGGAVGRRVLDADRERVRHRGHVGPGEDADDARVLERGRGVEADDARVRELRAEDRGVRGVPHRVDVVHEAALAAQQRLVLEARDGLPDPGLALGCDAHGASSSHRGSRPPRGTRT